MVAFLLNYPVQFYADSHHSGSGSNYCFAREFNALVSRRPDISATADQMVQLKGIPTWLETIQDEFSWAKLGVCC